MLYYADGDHRRKAGVLCANIQWSSSRETPGSDHGQALVVSGLLCSALASRFACARPAAWGTCVRALVSVQARARGRKIKEKERKNVKQKERKSIQLLNSCRQIWSNKRFAFVFLLFPSSSPPTQTSLCRSRLPLLPCFASVSPLCRCCGGYAEGYMWSSL